MRLLLISLAAICFAALAQAQNAPTNLPGCQYLATPGTLTDKQTTILQCTTDKELIVVPIPADGASNIASSSITRRTGTDQYTANTGWNTATSGSSYGTITGVCRTAGGQVLIPQIDIYSSANPATKLQGVLWLFSSTVGTPVNDNATFNIAAADFANLTGNQQGFAFTLTSTQASGAANSAISLTGTTYHARCATANTSMYYLMQVVNTYTPASAEVLTIKLHTIATN